jgi:hypothetical protein
MPYDDVPVAEPPPLPRPDEYKFRYDLTGTMIVPGADADSPPTRVRRSTIDDLRLFSPETKTSNDAMLEFLDRVVVDVIVQGRSIGAGVSHKGIPHESFRSLMEGVGLEIKELYNPGN